MKIKPFLAALLPGLILAYLLIFALTQPAPVQAAGFVVDTSWDGAFASDPNPGNGVCETIFSSDCTLRAAIEETNALAGWDGIIFASPMTITVDAGAGMMPAITDRLTIDASDVWDTTDDKPGVTLNGNNQIFNGFTLNADNSQISGLYIHNFIEIGVLVQSGSNAIGSVGSGQRNVISGNLIGIVISGSVAQNNEVNNNFIGITPAGNIKESNEIGVRIINGASNNIIGGTTAMDGNWIAGNTQYGVHISGAGTNNNKLGGNLIGGSTALGNTEDGVFIDKNASNTIIGGSGLPGNAIAGNGKSGIYVRDISGVTRIEDNIITGHSNSGGISLLSTNTQVISNTICNNFIGIWVFGTAATGNRLTKNRMYDNLKQGIDLSDGGNFETGPPLVTSATAAGASGTTCSSCTVEIFSDAAGEGKIYEGTTIADSMGYWNYTGILTGPNATATTTDSSNNTSEFSAPKALNAPPNIPSNPSPADSAAAVSLNPTLSWSGGDPDGDTVTYIVYGGQSSWVTSTLLYSGTTTSFSLTSLPTNTSYTWQVAADDGKGPVVQGPFWEFTTGSAANTPPNTPSNPAPADKAAGVSLNPTLSWRGGDPDSDPVIYQVWGDSVLPLTGEANTVNKIAATLWYSGTATTFNLSGLNPNTKYNWEVTADDGQGGSVQGPSWEFTTGSASYKLFLPAVLKP